MNTLAGNDAPDDDPSFDPDEEEIPAELTPQTPREMKRSLLHKMILGPLAPITMLVVMFCATLASCQSLDMKSIAIEVLKDVRVGTTVFMKPDSLCNEVSLSHPFLRDSTGAIVPYLFEKCWPLGGEPDSVGTSADTSAIGVLARDSVHTLAALDSI